MTPYSGQVKPGGPAIARTVQLAAGVAVEVRKFSVGTMDNNAYLITDLGSGTALLVDAAEEPQRILAELGERRLAGIVTTHGHPDHWQALAAVAEATGAPTYLHPADAAMVPRAADVPIADLVRIAVGEAEVELLHTPGHTPGSACVLLGGAHLFTGDTLFPGGPGNTRGPAAFATVMHSLRATLFALGDDVWVYPGHGDDTTIGAERGSLDAWQLRGWSSRHAPSWVAIQSALCGR